MGKNSWIGDILGDNRGLKGGGGGVFLGVAMKMWMMGNKKVKR